jgi:hypothetical protein
MPLLHRLPKRSTNRPQHSRGLGDTIAKVIRATTTKKPCNKPGCGGNPATPKAATPSRPSCLECVEKHLGSAMVLIGETNAGYDHRLLAIGHLNEAGEESQAWPELCQAIRVARKAYHADGTVPDFAALAGMAASVRGDE